MNKKENAGYQKTHQTIQDQLLVLLEKKELKKITVAEICGLCNINRSTFYAHYPDIYAVMEEIEQALYEELAEEFRDRYSPSNSILSYDLFLAQASHLQKHRVFYLAFLSRQLPTSFEKNRELLLNEVLSPIYEQHEVPENRRPYYFDFFWSGVMTVQHRWLKDGCRESPEEITNILYSCFPDYAKNIILS